MKICKSNLTKSLCYQRRRWHEGHSKIETATPADQRRDESGDKPFIHPIVCMHASGKIQGIVECFSFKYWPESLAVKNHLHPMCHDTREPFVIKKSTFTDYCVAAQQILTHIKCLLLSFGPTLFPFNLIFTSSCRASETIPRDNALAIFHCVFIYQHSPTLLSANKLTGLWVAKEAIFKDGAPRGTVIAIFSRRHSKKTSQPMTCGRGNKLQGKEHQSREDSVSLLAYRSEIYNLVPRRYHLFCSTS